MGLRRAWREAWAETRHLRPSRVAIEGDTRGSDMGIVELIGIDTHRPVRRPDRWKVITILGGEVRTGSRHLGRGLLECPRCGGLVADTYGQTRHQEWHLEWEAVEDPEEGESDDGIGNS